MYYFIINPSSCSGRKKQVWNELKEYLVKMNIPYCAAFTKGGGHAGKLAAQASGKASSDYPVTVVVVGGDGTANEVLNGLTLSEHLTFGYIPLGSGNDLARSLGLPTEPLTSLQTILNQENVRNIRIGKVKAEDDSIRRFFISSGIGYDAAVCHSSQTSRLKHIFNIFGAGKLIYLATALRHLLKLSGCSAELTLDDKETLFFRKIFFCAFMNMRYEGGGFMFCPDADPEDDFLDICLIKQMPKTKVLRLLPTAFSGKHIQHRDVVHIYRCRKAVIRTDAPLHTHTDGEGLNLHTNLEFSLETSPLSFIG